MDSIRRRLLAVLGTTVATTSAGCGLGGDTIEEPSVEVEDRGDWGEVTDSNIEVIHTFNIQNPNPVEAEVGDSTSLNLGLELNDIRLGSVQKSGLELQQGDNSVEVVSEINQNQLGDFWANFINQDETLHAEVTLGLEVDAGPGFSVSAPPVEVSAFTNETPVTDAMNALGAELERSSPYTFEVSTDMLEDRYRSDPELGPSVDVTFEYTVENLEFQFGDVSSGQTELLVDLRLRNSGEEPIPGVPDGLVIDIMLNSIEVFNARGEDVSPQNIDGDTILSPGEVRSYTLVATADNDNVEEWFTSYADQQEKSMVRVEASFEFDLGDVSITLPKPGLVAYECHFQSGIFVDDQNTSTTCNPPEEGTIIVETPQNSDNGT